MLFPLVQPRKRKLQETMEVVSTVTVVVSAAGSMVVVTMVDRTVEAVAMVRVEVVMVRVAMVRVEVVMVRVAMVRVEVVMVRVARVRVEVAMVRVARVRVEVAMVRVAMVRVEVARVRVARVARVVVVRRWPIGTNHLHYIRSPYRNEIDARYEGDTNCNRKLEDYELARIEEDQSIHTQHLSCNHVSCRN